MNDPISPIRAVIVGASGGIGLETCRLIHESGGSAHLIGRNIEKVQPVADSYGWTYSVADASNWEQLDAAFNEAVSTLGTVNAAINLAGSVLLKPAHLTSRVDWENTVSANITTAFGLVRAATTRMFQSGGSIVLLSSAAASIGLANHEAIAACKAAIEGLVRSAATTYASKSIRVNAIAPGLVETPLTERIWGNPRASEASLSMHPLGRFGKPIDIARAIYWLSCIEQNWITGQVIGVDGGLGRLKSLQSPPKPA